MKNTYSTCNSVFYCYTCRYCCMYLYMKETLLDSTMSYYCCKLIILIGIFNSLWNSLAVEHLGEELVHPRMGLLVWKRSDTKILSWLQNLIAAKPQFTQEWFDKDTTVDAN